MKVNLSREHSSVEIAVEKWFYTRKNEPSGARFSNSYLAVSIEVRLSWARITCRFSKELLEEAAPIQRKTQVSRDNTHEHTTVEMLISKNR